MQREISAVFASLENIMQLGVQGGDRRDAALLLFCCFYKPSSCTDFHKKHSLSVCVVQAHTTINPSSDSALLLNI